MSNTFEKLLEKQLSELNFLTTSGADIKPGSVLESLEKDIVIGYLPKYLKETSINEDSLKTEEIPYDIKLDKLSGITSAEGALDVMKMFGIKYNKNKTYKIDLEITGITAVRFANDIDKIDFEIALEEFAEQNRKIFRKFKNHFLVTKVVYADSFIITIETEKNGKFEADSTFNEVNFGGETKVEKKENAILVSNNKEIPFGVECYKIKNGKLKEKD